MVIRSHVVIGVAAVATAALLLTVAERRTRTHLVLPLKNLHASRDESSYDYGAVNRTSQFYGDAHWDLARPWLEAALGRREAPAAQSP